ncbi:MAG: YicC family protein [Paucibacter sp.]|nr:YicC family protein [Roseateles sp.]
MPVYSMTGYASATAHASSHGENSTNASTAVSVEMRSVNGRFLDLNLRMPEELRGLEPALRDLLTQGVKRGKVEVRINTQRENDNAWPQPQPEQLARLGLLQSVVLDSLPGAAPLSVQEALQWCRSGNSGNEKFDEPAMAAARQCLAGLVEARAREGEKLVAVLLERVRFLASQADAAEPLLPQVVQRQQQRFLERWQEALTATGAQQSVPDDVLRERALNEAAAYAIRIDVAEELARLRAHLDEIGRLLKKGGEIGKRLDFLIQELHREANTLGSKSAALELTNISVEMKVAIEQMREQVQNIE